MPAYVPEYLKSKNRQTVFNMFVKNMTLSRAQIVQETEMSFPTVSKAVDFLISRDIVRESKETSLPAKGPGRRRNQLVFNPAAFYALTLAFEGSSVEIGIADLAGGILRFETRPFANFTAKEKYDELADYLQAVLAELSQGRAHRGLRPFLVRPRDGGTHRRLLFRGRMETCLPRNQ